MAGRAPNTVLWSLLLTWTQRLGWPFSNGNSRAFCDERNWVGSRKVAPWALLSPSAPAAAAASLTFTVTFSRDRGGTRGWQGPPPGACQHNVTSAGSEHGAFSRQPCGGSSCSRVARQRLRCARGSAGRRLSHYTVCTQPSAPLPPWPLQVSSPFLKGQMLVLTASGSRGHTWKGNGSTD